MIIIEYVKCKYWNMKFKRLEKKTGIKLCSVTLTPFVPDSDVRNTSEIMKIIYDSMVNFEEGKRNGTIKPLSDDEIDNIL